MRGHLQSLRRSVRVLGMFSKAVAVILTSYARAVRVTETLSII
jgi:hypothetical protein